jgi:alpha-tubulin suppressor-like RCC1 family protein
MDVHGGRTRGTTMRAGERIRPRLTVHSLPGIPAREATMRVSTKMHVCLAAAGLVGVLLAPVTPAAAAPVTYTAYMWGGNDSGQLGNNTTTARLAPGAVTGLTDIVQFAGGRDHVVALDSTGHVWTWGSNASGQLGLGDLTDRHTPTMVPGLSGITAIASGHDHSMALSSSGTVYTWGLNTTGQLGDGSKTNRKSPVTVTGITDAVSIAAGRDMSYAIRANGQALAWGLNDDGELGDGTTTTRTAPVRVGTLTNVTAIAGGRDHGLALLSDGSVWAWGWNLYGQLGDGTTTDRLTPVQVIASGITSVVAGAHHSYALRSDGQVLAWGRNYRDELGDGTTTNRTRPVSVIGVTSAVSIASGRDHGIAVMRDGSVMTWGWNMYGQLGDGTTTNRSRAITVPGISGATVAGGGGEQYSAVLVPNGTQPPPNQNPTAAFTSACTQLACTFDASGSSDPDGQVTSYAWDFGDTTSGTGVTPPHTYAADGTYQVTLTVTDNDGGTGTVTHAVTVAGTPPPPPTSPVFRASAGTDANTGTPTVVVPSSVQPGDTLVLFLSGNRAATTTTPSGWTLVATATSGTDIRSWVFTRTAVAGTAGSSVTTTLDAFTKASMVLLAYSGAGPVSVAASLVDTVTRTAHPAPAVAVATSGSTVISYWVDKSSTAHSWTLPGTVTGRASTTGTGGGLLATEAADTSGVAAGTWPGVTATSGSSSAKEIGWSVVVPAA